MGKRGAGLRYRSNAARRAKNKRSCRQYILHLREHANSLHLQRDFLKRNDRKQSQPPTIAVICHYPTNESKQSLPRSVRWKESCTGITDIALSHNAGLPQSLRDSALQHHGVVREPLVGTGRNTLSKSPFYKVLARLLSRSRVLPAFPRSPPERQHLLHVSP